MLCSELIVEARCKLCGWKTRASSRQYAVLATDAHYRNTGHQVKLTA